MAFRGICNTPFNPFTLFSCMYIYIYVCMYVCMYIVVIIYFVAFLILDKLRHFPTFSVYTYVWNLEYALTFFVTEKMATTATDN